MITLTVGEALAANEALGRVMATKLPIKISYHLGRIGKLVMREIQTYDEARMKLVKELGAEVKPEDGKPATGQWMVKPENLQSFQEQMKALLEIPIKIDLDQISIASIPVTAEFAAADLMGCGNIFVE